MKRCLAFSAVTSLMAVAALAQVKETIQVNVVEVPVTVVDRAGNPVRGLTAKNFQLFDEGKKREITSFDVIDFASAESLTAISPLNPVARRSFLLLFDLGFSSPNSLSRAQEAARQFVKGSLQPADLVAVAAIDTERGCKLLTSFTTDRELIASAISNPASFRGLDPLGIANQTLAFIPELEQPGMANSPDVIAPPLHFSMDALVEQRDMARGMRYQNELASRQRVERNVNALGQLAQVLAPVPGRKQVVLLSEGLPSKYLVGRDVHEARAEAEQAEAIIRGTWWQLGAKAGDSDTDQRYGTSSTMTLLERMTNYFRRSDVILNAIDLQGVRVQNDTFEGARVNSNAGLSALARPTGGVVFENVNAVGENFRRMMHQQEVVYVLGFHAPSDNPGTFHDLKVKISGAPFGTRVEHRAGYFENAVAVERKLSNAEVVMNDIPQSGIQVASFAASFPTASERAEVPVIVEIDGHDLMEGTFLNGVAHLAIYAFDESGLVRDRLYQTLTFDRGKVAEKLRIGGVKFYGTLSLPPGNFAIKTLVWIPNGDRRGYTRADVRVPRPGEFWVTPFVVDEHAADWLMVKGTSHGSADAGYPFQMSGEPLVPAARPRLHPGESSKLALFVQNARPEELQLDMLPNVTLLATTATTSATKILLQATAAGPETTAFEIVVRKQTGNALRARVPIVVK